MNAVPRWIAIGLIVGLGALLACSALVGSGCVRPTAADGDVADVHAGETGNQPGAAGVGADEPTAADAGVPGDYVGDSVWGEVFIVPGYETQWVELRGATTEKLGFFDAAVLPNGDLLLSSTSEGLVLRSADGASRELMPAKSLIGHWLDPTGRWVAFGWPLEWSWSEVNRVGVGLYDLVTQESRLLLSDPERDIRLFGWIGERVIFWWNHGERPSFRTVDLEGNEEPLADCPADLRLFFPMRGSLLPFETKDGVLGILDFASLEVRYVEGASQVHWVKAGLEALRGERWEIVLEVGDE